MRAVIDEMYQIAGELLLNTSDSQISVLALQTMMMQNVTKFYNRHKKLYAGKPVHCPAAFGTWDWEMKLREIRFQIEAIKKAMSTINSEQNGCSVD